MVLVIIIIAASVVVLALIAGVVILWLRGAVGRRLGEATAELEADGIVRTEPAANSFGFLAQPIAQVRGNGTLILTSKALEFFMLVPKKRVTVPLDKVTRLDSPMWWKGKSVASRLLAIYYVDEAGGDNGIAFWVRDLNEWLKEISDTMAAAGLSPGEIPRADG